MFVDIVAGYLGAGKTTLMGRFIADAEEPERLVVLVNEFGELGIDSLLMAGANDVVELSSGCICCTLRMDFRAQIEEIGERLNPRRLLIEPTGVATTGQVLKALRHSSLANLVEGVRVFTLVDAPTFNERMKESPRFFTSQVQAADVVVLSKPDLVPSERVPVLVAAVESLAPDAWVISAERGELPGEFELPPYRAPRDAPESERLDDLVSLNYRLPAVVGMESLRELFRALKDGEFGPVERAKALAECADGWHRFDLAGSTYEEQPTGPVPEGRLVVIGRDLMAEKMNRSVRRLEGIPATGRSE